MYRAFICSAIVLLAGCAASEREEPAKDTDRLVVGPLRETVSECQPWGDAIRCQHVDIDSVHEGSMLFLRALDFDLDHRADSVLIKRIASPKHEGGEHEEHAARLYRGPAFFLWSLAKDERAFRHFRGMQVQASEIGLLQGEMCKAARQPMQSGEQVAARLFTVLDSLFARDGHAQEGRQDMGREAICLAEKLVLADRR